MTTSTARGLKTVGESTSRGLHWEKQGYRDGDYVESEVKSF
jgi:hypothetical protein